MLKIVFYHRLFRSVNCLNAYKIQVLGRYYCEDKSKKSDLYDSLGLKSSASQSEIKKAYYDLTFKYHPDRNEGSVSASTKFREVTEAYEVLGNYGLRKRYDKGLPLPPIKRKVGSAQSLEEPNVKYQSFYDSRAHSRKSEKFTPIENEYNDGYFSPKEDLYKDDDTLYKESKGVRVLLAVIVCVCLIVARIYGGSE